MKTIDMIAKPCPIPVIEAKKTLAEPGCNGVRVLVDNQAAVNNLERLAENLGCRYSCASQPNNRYAVTLIPGAEPLSDDTALSEPQCHLPDSARGVTVLIKSDRMGSGSDELGAILIKGFVFSLTELPVLPEAVLFLNAGVKLGVAGANTVGDLKNLEEKGVQIRFCGTCLDYFKLTDTLAVGAVTDMYGIATTLAQADRVVSI